MNNYELATDEYCYKYKRYKKKFEWRHFKRKDWVWQQHLTEKYNIVLVGHRTKIESYKYYFDRVISTIIRYLRSGKKKNPRKLNLTKPRKNIKIFPEKSYDFDEINNRLFGKRKKVF